MLDASFVESKGSCDFLMGKAGTLGDRENTWMLKAVNPCELLPTREKRFANIVEQDPSGGAWLA